MEYTPILSARLQVTYICPCSVVAYNPDFRVFRDIHAMLSDLYLSTRLTKFDAVKGSNRTYTCSEESVNFWWFFD